VLTGALQDRETWPSAGTALRPLGASGKLAGVTALDATEAAEVPPALVAVEVKV
jgi:hypothetical protein